MAEISDSMLLPYKISSVLLTHSKLSEQSPSSEGEKKNEYQNIPLQVYSEGFFCSTPMEVGKRNNCFRKLPQQTLLPFSLESSYGVDIYKSKLSFLLRCPTHKTSTLELGSPSRSILLLLPFRPFLVIPRLCLSFPNRVTRSRHTIPSPSRGLFIFPFIYKL